VAAPKRRPCPEVSLVIPVFDEEDNLATLLAEIEAAMADGGQDYEIVAVDDGSTDGGLALLRSAAASDRRLRVLANPQRLGQSAALAAGI
jgi:glycosyltransferase involved in cell wall biosynthesis